MGYRIKEVREEKHLTQEEISRKSGVSRATICALESGETVIAKTDTLLKLAKALDKPIGQIFLDD